MNILKTKRQEITAAIRQTPLQAMKEQASIARAPRDFLQVLKGEGCPIIAEIKKSSPSRGLLTHDFDHRLLAAEYTEGGARALSVLTDVMFFQGHSRFIQDVKEVTPLPVLRKDFIIEEYQVYESRAIGADALLLIVRILEESQLRKLYERTMELGMVALVEVHDETDLERANRLRSEVIGINNRNLADFGVSLENSLTLRPRLWAGALSVSESGIRSQDDVRALRGAGFHAVLVGEGVVTKKDRVRALRELVAA